MKQAQSIKLQGLCWESVQIRWGRASTEVGGGNGKEESFHGLYIEIYFRIYLSSTLKARDVILAGHRREAESGGCLLYG